MPKHTTNINRGYAGSVSGGCVTVTFDYDATRHDAEHYAEAQGWFGYHPAGYGGSWRQQDARTWVYSFRVTGD
jgi:hypothetical protein